MYADSPFFRDLQDNIEIEEGEEEEEDTPVDTAPGMSDYDWLVQTIRRLCEQSGNMDEYQSICDEMVTRGIIPTPGHSRGVPRFGSPFPQVYTTLETVGQGGYAKVMKIQNLIDKQIYALKVVEVDRREVSSAVREIQCLAHMNSPYVVRYYSSWVDEKPGGSKLLLYIQMEFIQGQSLAALLDSRTPLSDENIHRMLWELAHAVAEIHAVGIVHRDLRPANIMLREDGSVVIIDFGIASSSRTEFSSVPRPASCVYQQKRVGSLTMRPLDKFCLQEAVRDCDTIRSVGTPMYSSPRQLNGVKSTRADDMYSFGIIMYEMLARFRTRMEKTKAVEALRVHGNVGEAFAKKYPAETELILRLVSPHGRDRPSAVDLLQTDMFQAYAPKCSDKQ